MNRTLSPYEYFSWLIDSISPYNLMVGFKLEGYLTEKIIRRVLDALQIKHPFLQVTIVKKGDVLSFRKISSPLSVEKVSEKTETKWKHCADEKLYGSLIKENKPLFQLYWREINKNEHEIFIKVSHIIVDGKAMVSMANEFINFCDLALSHEPIAFSPLLERPTFETMLPELAAKLTTLKHQFKKKGKLESTPVKSAYIHRVIDEESFKNITKKAKEKNIGLHSLVCAAMTLGLYHAHQKELSEIKVVSPHSMRHYLHVDLQPDELGNYVGGIFQTVEDKKLLETADVWLLAKQVEKNLQREIKEKRVIQNVANTVNMSLSCHTAEDFLSKMQENRAGPAVGCSNLGVVSIPTKTKALQVRDIAFSSNIPALWNAEGRYFVLFSTWNNSMQLSFSYTTPTVAKEIANQFVNQTLEKLEAVISK